MATTFNNIIAFILSIALIFTVSCKKEKQTTESPIENEDSSDFDTVPCRERLIELDYMTIDYGSINNTTNPKRFSDVESDGTTDGTYLVKAKLYGYNSLEVHIEMGGLFIPPGKHIYNLQQNVYYTSEKIAKIKIKPNAFVTSNGFESYDGDLYVEKTETDSLILSFCNQTLFYPDDDRIIVSGSFKVPINEVYNY
jgi:hypothetical protein